jgi:hypothetical protein
MTRPRDPNDGDTSLSSSHLEENSSSDWYTIAAAPGRALRRSDHASLCPSSSHHGESNNNSSNHNKALVADRATSSSGRSAAAAAGGAFCCDIRDGATAATASVTSISTNTLDDFNLSITSFSSQPEAAAAVPSRSSMHKRLTLPERQDEPSLADIDESSFAAEEDDHDSSAQTPPEPEKKVVVKKKKKKTKDEKVLQKEKDQKKKKEKNTKKKVKDATIPPPVPEESPAEHDLPSHVTGLQQPATSVEGGDLAPEHSYSQNCDNDDEDVLETASIDQDDDDDDDKQSSIVPPFESKKALESVRKAEGEKKNDDFVDAKKVAAVANFWQLKDKALLAQSPAPIIRKDIGKNPPVQTVVDDHAANGPALLNQRTWASSSSVQSATPPAPMSSPASPHKRTWGSNVSHQTAPPAVSSSPACQTSSPGKRTWGSNPSVSTSSSGGQSLISPKSSNNNKAGLFMVDVDAQMMHIARTRRESTQKKIDMPTTGVLSLKDRLKAFQN